MMSRGFPRSRFLGVHPCRYLAPAPPCIHPFSASFMPRAEQLFSAACFCHHCGSSTQNHVATKEPSETVSSNDPFFLKVLSVRFGHSDDEGSWASTLGSQQPLGQWLVGIEQQLSNFRTGLPLSPCSVLCSCTTP